MQIEGITVSVFAHGFLGRVAILTQNAFREIYLPAAAKFDS